MYYLAIISDIYISYLCLRQLFSACCVLSLMSGSNSKRKNNIHFLQEHMTLLREMDTWTENNIYLPSVFNILERAFICVVYNILI